MASNNSELSPSEWQAKISELRKTLLDKYGEDTTRYGKVDDRDIERAKTDDIWLKQFLFARKTNVHDAMVMMETSLKWRKEMEINDLNEDTVPREVFEKGAIYFHSCDKDGHDILYLRIKDNKKDAETRDMVKKYLAYLLEKHHTEKKDERIVALMDATDMGISNVDMDLLKFEITCFTTYFPCLLHNMLIFDMPWLANAIWKIVKTWLSAEQQKRVIFVKKDDIQEYIDRDKLWVHMGGTDDYEYKYFPNSNSNSSTVSNGDVGDISGASVNTPGIKKKVTFNESSMIGQTPNSIVPRGFSKPLLQTSCTGEVHFPATTSGTETRYTMTLTNNRAKPVSFKVKTTTPAGYRVRPGSDVIQPGKSMSVDIVCLPAHQEKCPKDRFLLMAAEVDGEDFDMKNVPPEFLYTQRYNVAYGLSSPGAGDQSVTGKRLLNLPDVTEQLDRLAKQVDMMVIQQKQQKEEFEEILNVAKKIQHIVLLTFIILVSAIIYYVWNRSTVMQLAVASTIDQETSCPSTT